MKSIQIIGETGDYPEPKPWIFKPVRVFKLKLFLDFNIIVLLIGSFCGFLLWILEIEGELKFLLFGFSVPFLFWSIFGLTIFLTIVFSVIGINKYVNSIEYRVHGTEIIIKKGLFNITEEHVPFANITNIAFRKGPFDQILNIGSIHVHTAGKRNDALSIIKIEGIYVYKEVGYFVLKQIKSVESFLSRFIIEKPKYSSIFTNDFWKKFLETTSEIKLNLKEG